MHAMNWVIVINISFDNINTSNYGLPIPVPYLVTAKCNAFGHFSFSFGF